jgi:CHAT domain-containing protein
MPSTGNPSTSNPEEMHECNATSPQVALIRLLVARSDSMSDTERTASGAPSFDAQLQTAVQVSEQAMESQQPARIAEAVWEWRAVLAHPSALSAQPDLRANILIRAGDAFSRSYAVTGEVDSLDDAIAAQEQAKAIVSTTDPLAPHVLHALATNLLTRYEVRKASVDLDAAIEAFRQAVAITVEDSPDLPGYLGNLSIPLWARYAISSHLSDLNELIAALRRAIDRLPSDSPETQKYLPGYQATLAMALWRRYGRIREPSDLDAAIVAYEQLLDNAPQDSPHYTTNLGNMGDALLERSRSGSHQNDLDAAIDAYRKACDRSRGDSSNRSLYLEKLGHSLTERYERSGNHVDLDAAIESYQHAVDLESLDSTEIVGELANLGNGFWRRYNLSHNKSDLDAAVEAHRRAALQQQADRGIRAYNLERLAVGLAERSELTRDIGDLDAAIEAHKEAIECTPHGMPNLPSLLGRLGGYYWRRYHLTGALNALTASIDTLSRAVNIADPQPTRLADHFVLLGTGLQQRYTIRGRMHDLDTAVESYRQAISFYPTDSPRLPACLHLLGESLHDRYRHTGRVSDLDGATQAIREAVNLVPAEPEYLGSLGSALLDRYELMGDPRLLAAAIDALDRVEERAPLNWSKRPALLTIKGNALWARYNRDKRPADLDAAIEAYRETIRVSNPEAERFPQYLGNLGTGLVGRYTYTRRLTDLDDAVEAQERAAKEIRPGSPRESAFHNNLGVVLQERHKRKGLLADKKAAVDAYRQACVAGIDMATEVALSAAQVWGGWASDRGEWPEAVEAYRFAISAMERIVHIQLARSDKQEWLNRAQGLTIEAAYATARGGAGEEAVLILEKGRTMLLTGALDRNWADLGALKQQGHTQLALRYERVAARLRELDVGLVQDAGVEPNAEEAASAWRELEEAIAEIRAVPDFSTFLAPISFEHVQEAASEAPLAYLAAASAGGVGLIVRSGRPVERLWLPALTADSLRRVMLDYVRAYYSADQAAGTFETVLDRVTKWLGANAMLPLLNATRNEHRVVLIPAGWLTALPLHAAWAEDPVAPEGRFYAMDQLCISYAPTARMLRHGRAVACDVDPNEVLIVEDPRPTSGSALPSAPEEAQSVSSMFAVSLRLRHEEATRDAVIAALPDYSVLHFCCHGYAIPPEPMSSGLLLAHDEFVTVRDFVVQRLPDVRLAVLSACETAFPGLGLPDEVIGLPSALLEAGVAGVVASLWPVLDLSTMVLMVRFYDLWRNSKIDPPEALWRAQKWLRRASNAEVRDYLPRIASLAAPPPTAGSSTAEWEGGHRFAQPYYWAAFTYAGA